MGIFHSIKLLPYSPANCQALMAEDIPAINSADYQNYLLYYKRLIHQFLKIKFSLKRLFLKKTSFRKFFIFLLLTFLFKWDLGLVC